MSVTLSLGTNATAASTARAAALIAGLSVIRDDAIERTPIREGDLRGSCAIDSDGTQGTVYYDSVYAARQHEEVGWNHPNGGGAKFLENALNDSGEAALEAIAAHLRGAL